MASDRLAKLRFLIGDEIGGADALGFKEEGLLKHVGLILDDVKLLQKRRDLNDGEEVVRYVLTAKDLLCLIKDQSSLLKVDHALEMILERILDHHDLLKMSTNKGDTRPVDTRSCFTIALEVVCGVQQIAKSLEVPLGVGIKFAKAVFESVNGTVHQTHVNCGHGVKTGEEFEMTRDFKKTSDGTRSVFVMRFAQDRRSDPLSNLVGTIDEGRDHGTARIAFEPILGE